MQSHCLDDENDFKYYEIDWLKGMLDLKYPSIFTFKCHNQ